ncbi:MAG: GAF domain-containing protein [Synergistaceae bacterium]|jgi:GAF domain-containing protein|nr:GAF domain-containing protein [Synergistaceae bacterium]
MEVDVRKFEDKEKMYAHMNESLVHMLEGNRDETAALSNVSALLNLYLEEINWVGFYLMKNGALILGPFQGKPAVMRILPGEGVCGTTVQEGKTRVVDDVHTCTNHIACDLASSSEIVVPLIKNGQVLGVLDIDSPIPSRFDEEDKKGLESVAQTLLNVVFIC